MQILLRPLGLGSLAMAALVLAASAAQGAVSLLSDDRHIHAEFFDPYFSQTLDESPPVPFAAWNDQVYAGGAYFADQDSETVTAVRMAASGTADGFSEIGRATSTFSITFDVDAAVSYVLSGSVGENPVALNDARISLSQGATTLFAATANGDTQPFFDTGILAPGQYTLFAEADWQDNAESLPPVSATYDFVFQVVPEPGTGLLVAVGCLVLVCSRRLERRTA